MLEWQEQKARCQKMTRRRGIRFWKTEEEGVEKERFGKSELSNSGDEFEKQRNKEKQRRRELYKQRLNSRGCQGRSSRYNAWVEITHSSWTYTDWLLGIFL